MDHGVDGHPVATIRPAAPEGRRPPLVGRHLALLSIVSFWLFYFVLNTLRSCVAGGDGQLGHLGPRAVVSCIGMVLSFLLYVILLPLDRAGMRLRVAVAFAASVPISLAYSAINFEAFALFAPNWSLRLEVTHDHIMRATPLAQIVDSAAEWYFFIVAWAVLYIAMSNAAQAQLAERRAGLYRAEAQAAQLRALRYQLNPHFLFNTLNSLSTLVMRGHIEPAERMIMMLSTFLRASLVADPTADVTLADEIEAQLLYLDIEQVRFPDRLHIQIEMPSQLQAALLPGFLLQPLVENAIKYGVARTTRPVTITIRAYAENAKLYLAVEDDGEGAPASASGPGVGLGNVAARLLARFGTAASCRFGSRPEGGFGVYLSLPLLQHRL
jgi:signal transduction histidine kinase